MKNKTARSVLESFGSIVSEGRKPEKLRTYKGTEFMNESFEQYLNNNKNIQFYAENNKLKASVVERVNRTLKSKLYCYFTAVNSLRYIDVLQDLVDSYDNTYHRSIGDVHQQLIEQTILCPASLLKTLQHSRMLFIS